MIFANALVLYLESTRLRLPFSGNTLNTVFLTAYGVELALRIVHFRLGFFVEMPDAPWNWVDSARPRVVFLEPTKMGHTLSESL